VRACSILIFGGGLKFCFDNPLICDWHSKRSMKHLFFALSLATAMSAVVNAADKETPVYELRTYYAAPGKLDDLQARFRNHTMKIFEKHGMKNIGYWVPIENPDHKLIYMLEFPSREAAGKSWKEFGADPDWKSAQKASEANGKLVEKAQSVFLKPTDYSPEIKPSASGATRVFELRTYKASPGKLDALNSRFRDHTGALFKKHGMTNFGYWTPIDKKQGAEDTLIYILAHKSKAAGEASFKAFREDPDWIAAKKASEEGGSLTAKVESVYMTPTDYSPTK
jgi:hypothetical protein